MKILTRGQFLKMPPGTVYAAGGEWTFGSWNVKLENCCNDKDWFYQALDPTGAADFHDLGDMCDKLMDARDNGTSIPLTFEETARDGSFNDKALYAVMEPADVQLLIKRLQELAKENP